VGGGNLRSKHRTKCRTSHCWNLGFCCQTASQRLIFQVQFRYQQNSIQDNLVFLYEGLYIFNEKEIAADTSRYRPFSNKFNTSYYLLMFMSLCFTTQCTTLTELCTNVRGILHPVFGEIFLPHFTGVLLFMYVCMCVCMYVYTG